MRAFVLICALTLSPTIAAAQSITWKLISTTDGLVLAPAYPAFRNDIYFERQRRREWPQTTSTVVGMATVRPYSLERRPVLIDATLPPSPSPIGR